MQTRTDTQPYQMEGVGRSVPEWNFSPTSRTLPSPPHLIDEAQSACKVGRKVISQSTIEPCGIQQLNLANLPTWSGGAERLPSPTPITYTSLSGWVSYEPIRNPATPWQRGGLGQKLGLASWR